MPRLLRRLLGRLIFWSASLVIAVAVLFSLARMLLPLSEDYLGHVEAWISERSGLILNVQGLDIDWRGWSPGLILEDAQLRAPQSREYQSVGAVRLVLDPWRSLRAGTPVLGELGIERLDLHLYRDASGRLLPFTGDPADRRGEGAPRPDRPDAAGMILRMADSVGALRVKHLSLHARDARGRDLTLIRQATLQAQRDKTHWKAALQWRTDEDTSRETQRLRLRLDRAAPALSGQVYLALSQIHLPHLQQQVEALFPGVLDGALGGCPRPGDTTCAWALPRLDAGEFAGEAWLDFHDGRLVEVVSDVVIRDLVATRVRERAVPVARSQFDEVSTRARWRLGTRAGDWSLLFDAVRVDGPGPSVPSQKIWLAQRGARLHAGGESVDLAALRTWLAVSPLPEPLHELIGDTGLSGQVHDPVLVFSDGQLLHGYLGLRDVRWLPRGMMPGLLGETAQTGLNADLFKLPEGWVLQVPRQTVSLESPTLFDAPLDPLQIEGALFLAEAGTLRVFAPDLRLALPGLQTRTRFDLRLAPEGPVADIESHFEAPAVAPLTRHLPVGVMDPAAVAWLRRALDGAGRIDNGRLRIEGALAQMPFHRADDQGRFEARFDYRDLDLAYDRHWLPAQDLVGQIRFVGNRFEAQIDRGLVNGVRLLDGMVSIPRLERPHVDLALSLRGPIDRQIGYLEASPLLSPDLLSGLQFGHEADLSLDIFVPLLKRDGTTQVRGRLTLDEASLSIPAASLELEALKGTLDFHNERISGTDLGGKLDGEPLRLAVATTGAQGTQATEITARGRIDPLFAFRPAGWAEPLSGRTEVDARVVIPHAMRNEPILVTADSALLGVTLALPEPFGKPESLAQRTRLEARLHPDGHRDLALSLPERLGARLSWRAPDRGLAGNLQFGSGVLPEERPVPDGGFVLSGTVGPLDLAHWARFVRRSVAPSGAADAGKTAHLPVSGAVRVERLDLGRLAFPGAHLQIDMGSADRWQFDVDSDRSAGQLVLHRQDGRVRDAEAHFERLWIEAAGDSDAARPGPTRPDEAKPLSIANWPNLRLSAADLRYDGRSLGSLSLEGRAAPGAGPGQHRWSIPEVLITRPGLYSLQANGSVDEDEDGMMTSMNVGMHSEEVGALLKTLGGGSAIEGGRLARAGLSVAWPGPPHEPDLMRLVGNGDFVIEDGRLREVDTGAGRLLGLFSIGALARRLSLDFRDVFSEGFAFDNMIGRISFSEGRMAVEPLEIHSPSLLAVLEGTTDLQTEQLDYQMAVYADVGMLLPIIGTVAGGPLVGGAVLLAQQLIRQSDTRLEPTMRYRIRGTIDEPKLQRAGRNEND
ncbi:MAG: YhdP family protein [Halothiobacillaceae bacterium]